MTRKSKSKTHRSDVIALKLPTTWTHEQILVVYEFISDLQNAVGERCKELTVQQLELPF